MQAIIIEKPYRFVPPHRGNWVPTAIQKTRLIDLYLNRYEGIQTHEIRGAELLVRSLASGHGILLAPNHCRYADPVAMGWLARQSKTHLFAMASWHLFNHHWMQTFAIRMCGGFSVYREGMDRKSLDMAVNVLDKAERPLVIFPEGTVFRSNDIVQPLLEGVSFIAKSAARRRAKHGDGKILVHPVAIKYVLRGRLEDTALATLNRLEERLLTRKPFCQETILTRVQRLNEAVLSLRETNCFGSPQTGDESERRSHLVDKLLGRNETRWLSPAASSEAKMLGLLPRIKQLRTEVVLQMRKQTRQDSACSDSFWASLEDLYIAQQVGSHPVHYLDHPTDSRLLETIERIEEDVTDHYTVQRPLHCIIEVGEAIEVSTERVPRGEADPLTEKIYSKLTNMLMRLSLESQPI